jgi:hypothetical protein
MPENDPPFKYGDKVELFERDLGSGWPVGTQGIVLNRFWGSEKKWVMVQSETGHTNLLDPNCLRLVINRKSPINVDPKDIVVEKIEEDHWNPYPIKEENFYDEK